MRGLREYFGATAVLHLQMLAHRLCNSLHIIKSLQRCHSQDSSYMGQRLQDASCKNIFPRPFSTRVLWLQILCLCLGHVYSSPFIGNDSRPILALNEPPSLNRLLNSTPSTFLPHEYVFLAYARCLTRSRTLIQSQVSVAANTIHNLR